MSFLALLLSLASVPPEATQPPVDRLLDDEGIARAVETLAESPRVRVEILGTSHEGRPLYLVAVGRPDVMARVALERARARRLASPRFVRRRLADVRLDDEPLETLSEGAHWPVLFAGGSWGHEAAQVEGLLAAAHRLAFDDDEEVLRALDKTVALFIPSMNPDGYARARREWRQAPLAAGETGAGNAYGLLLNRDFVHATQPESRAVLAASMRWRPLVAVDEHEDMFVLGVQRPEVAFVEPFDARFDVESHPLTRAAIVDIGGAIARRWRARGFRVAYDERGETGFAATPPPGEGLGPAATSAGRLNLMWTLHGIVGLITESARTPGTQSWEDRVAQKREAVFATLLEVASRPERYARAVYERRRVEATEGRGRFVVVPIEDQPPDGLRELVAILRRHEVEIHRVGEPYPALVVPVEQAEARLVRTLLLAERSRLDELPPALGVRIVPSEELSPAEREAFLAAALEPPWLAPPEAPSGPASAFSAPASPASTAFVNALLDARAARIARVDDRYVVAGPAASVLWRAERDGVPLRVAAAPPPGPSATARPRVAIYAGQGVDRTAWGEIAWALEAMAFPYRLLVASDLVLPELLEEVDAIIVPDGSADEILHGWDLDVPTRRPPWQTSFRPAGIGERGREALVTFVERGGTYIGIGAGGALLASAEGLGLVDVRLPPTREGIGRVRLRVARPASPLAFGYRGAGELRGFFYAPRGPSRGYVLRAPTPDAVVLRYAGVETFPPEQAFVDPTPLSADAGGAALVATTKGFGKVVLFGIAPTFRGQWRATFLLLANALHAARARN